MRPPSLGTRHRHSLLPRDHLQAWAGWVRVGVCDVAVADGSTGVVPLLLALLSTTIDAIWFTRRLVFAACVLSVLVVGPVPAEVAVLATVVLWVRALDGGSTKTS